MFESNAAFVTEEKNESFLRRLRSEAEKLRRRGDGQFFSFHGLKNGSNFMDFEKEIM